MAVNNQSFISIECQHFASLNLNLGIEICFIIMYIININLQLGKFMDRISSRNNDVIKHTKKLLTSSKARRNERLFVLEGARLCFDVMYSDYSVDTLLVTQKILDKYPNDVENIASNAVNTFTITDDVAQKLGDTSTSQGIFAVCRMKECDAGMSGRCLAALDNVQDPANIGAIIRTAEALGINGIIVGGGCDVFNPKALRASMGSALRLSIAESDDLVRSLLVLKNDGYSLYATVPDASAISITNVDFGGKTVCVIGNEANGISPEIIGVCDRTITIPMLGRAESLNAAAAASIVMWEMMR